MREHNIKPPPFQKLATLQCCDMSVSASCLQVIEVQMADDKGFELGVISTSRLYALSWIRKVQASLPDCEQPVLYINVVIYHSTS